MATVVYNYNIDINIRFMDAYIVRWGYPPTYTWAGPPGDRCGTPMLAVSIGHRAEFGSVRGYESKPWDTLGTLKWMK